MPILKFNIGDKVRIIKRTQEEYVAKYHGNYEGCLAWGGINMWGCVGEVGEVLWLYSKFNAYCVKTSILVPFTWYEDDLELEDK